MQHFTDEAAAIAYIKDELISTLQDDLYRMEGKESASYEDEDREEMRARIADLEAIMPRLQLAPVTLDADQCCPVCARDFGGDEEPDAQPGQPCPATDDCPSHWEMKGIEHPDHPTA